jgi:hypothetical protein
MYFDLDHPRKKVKALEGVVSRFSFDKDNKIWKDIRRRIMELIIFIKIIKKTIKIINWGLIINISLKIKTRV